MNYHSINILLHRLKSAEAKDVYYLSVFQIMSYILPLFVIPYLMTKLGSAGYGYYAFSFAFVSYFSLFIDFGFNLSATKRLISVINNDREEYEKVFSGTLFAKLMLLLISFVILLTVTQCVNSLSDYRTYIYYSLPILLGQSITLNWYYQSLGKIRILTTISVLSRIIILPFTFILVKSSEDINIAILIQSSTFFLSGVISILYIYLYHPIKIRFCKLSRIKKELLESSDIFLSNVATTLYTQLFTIVLGFFSTPSAVGIYASADRIVRSCCAVIYSPISIAFFPKVATVAKESYRSARILIDKLLKFSALLMLLVGLIIFFTSEIIVSFLNNDYVELPMLLRILSIVPLLVSIGGICGQMGLVANGNKKTKKEFRNIYFQAAIISIICMFVLIPRYNEVGAAISLIITEATVTIGMFYRYVKAKVNQLEC